MIHCDKCREELAEYALRQSDPATAAAVAEHLRGCDPCRRELAALDAAWSALPMALAPAPPRPELFDRILARVDAPQGAAPPHAASLAEAVGGAAPRAARRVSRRERALSYILAASVLVGLSAAYYKLVQPDDAAEQRSAENLAERLGNLQQLERRMRSDNVRLVSFKRAESPDLVEAYLLVDLAAGQWHFYAKLSPAPEGKTYQLWAADDDGRLFAGPTFAVNSEGFGRALVDLPELRIDSATKAVVTLEPAGGSKQPSGKVSLEASL